MQNVQYLDVINAHRDALYKQCYEVLHDSKENLFDISQHDTVIAIDCCGWYYQKLFDQPVISLETLLNAKQFGLTQQHFTKLIDDRDSPIKWPKLNLSQDSVVLFDRSLILKYRTISEFSNIVQTVGSLYRAKKILIRGNLQFVDDDRLRDRFYNWNSFGIQGFVITKFVYDTDLMKYEICLKKKI